MLKGRRRGGRSEEVWAARERKGGKARKKEEGTVTDVVPTFQSKTILFSKRNIKIHVLQSISIQKKLTGLKI